MDKIKNVLKKMVFPPPAFALTFGIAGLIFVAAVLIYDIKDPLLRYGSYLISTYSLIILVAAAVGLIRKNPLGEKIRSTKIGEKYFGDIHFRTGVSLYQGFFVNLLYIIIKLTSGIIYRSEWFVSLAVYYILLALMRFLLVRRLNVRDETKELKRYRLCGIMLLFMNQALAGIVIFMVYENRHFTYPGYLIYAMAAYSFYAMTVAIINVIKTRRHKSPVLSAAKAINLVAAMVSILSLTTAMLAQFGGDGDTDFNRVMTGAVGGGVCTIVIIMAIYMIFRANYELKKIRKDVKNQ